MSGKRKVLDDRECNGEKRKQGLLSFQEKELRSVKVKAANI